MKVLKNGLKATTIAKARQTVADKTIDPRAGASLVANLGPGGPALRHVAMVRSCAMFIFRRSTNESIRAVLWLTAVVLLFCAPMFFHLRGFRSDDAFRMADWLHDISFYFNLDQGLFSYGEFPLRSHLVGGGYPILGHPSDGTLSPFVLPFLILPAWLAIRVNLIALLWIGSLGMFLLARRVIGMSREAALLSASAFAVSGWFPSFMLVGFYVQAFYLLVPLILYFLLRPEGGWRSGVAAGLLLWPILAQTGNGVLAIGHFLVVATFFFSLDRDDPTKSELAKRLGLGFAFFAGISVSISYRDSFTWAFPALVLAVTTVLSIKWTPARRLWSLWSPRLLRLTVAGLVLVSVGAAKWVAVEDVLAQGVYLHAKKGGAGEHYQFEKGTGDDKLFYRSVPNLLHHLNRSAYVTTDYSTGWPEDPEYASVGLTYAVVIVFFAALALGGVRLWPLLVLWGIYVGICLGPHFPGDLYRSFIWGLPGYHRFNDPYKYFNFFLVLTMTLPFGWLVDRFKQTRRHLAIVAGAALLIWPFAQNSPYFAVLLKNEVGTLTKAESFYQVHQIPTEADLAEGLEHIKKRGMELVNRERVRPDTATEFFNVPRGVGVIDWYNDIHIAEHAVPRFYVLPDGTRLANPEYRGEMWCEPGPCTVAESRISPNTITASVTNAAPTELVVNQNYSRHFRGSPMSPVERSGRLAMPLPEPGTHKIALKYRPGKQIAALVGSLLSLLLWVGVLLSGLRKKALRG